MRVAFHFFLFFTLALQCTFALGEEKKKPFDFKGDYYERSENSLKGVGNAWVKQDNQEVWAHEIEVDFAKGLIFASKDVHIKDGNSEIWCSSAVVNMGGTEATFHDATMFKRQMILKGKAIRKISAGVFHVEEGSYTNCNSEHVRDEDLSKCTFDWTVYGRLIEAEREGYIKIYDAIVYAKKMPVFYTPFFIAPLKSQRQSGILVPEFTSSAALGSSFTLPYFQVLGPWHDLTFYPTHFSKKDIGFWMNTNYRYLYAPGISGDFNFSFASRRFGDDKNNLDTLTPGKDPFLGVLGEYSFIGRNEYPLGRRAYTRQILKYLSNPYYAQNYLGNFGTPVYDAYLRSNIFATWALDSWLLAAQIAHFQPLVISEDHGVDGGPVTQLPRLIASKISSPLFSKYFSYELDMQFDNFERSSSYDNVPSIVDTSSVTAGIPSIANDTDASKDYDSNDYIRTGRRFMLIPRLIANIPIANGLQFQPAISAGFQGYHLTVPHSRLKQQSFIDIAVPLSFYLGKTFETNISGFEKIHHVIQPRIIYEYRPFQHRDDDEFFGKGFDIRSNVYPPAFDNLDQVNQFHLVRFEFENRLRRKSGDEISRFFLLRVSFERYLERFPLNSRQNIDDAPIEAYKDGPISVFAEFTYRFLTAQFLGTFDTSLTSGVRESQVTASLTYSPTDSPDSLSFYSVISTRANQTTSQKTMNISFTKELPTFFDLMGGLEYSFLRGEVRGYTLGFKLGNRKNSCWRVDLTFGRSATLEHYATLKFGFNLGGFSSDSMGLSF